MLKKIVAEHYNRVEFKDLLNGKYNQGVTNLFSNNDFVIVAEGIQGEKNIYVDNSIYNVEKREMYLEFILYNKVLYITGSSAELRHNFKMSQGIEFTKVANECGIKTKLWKEVAEQFLDEFIEKYTNYVIYSSIEKQDKYSSLYNSYVESNIDKIRRDQYGDGMLGIFEPMDIYENVWLNQNKGIEFTKIDIIKYVLGEKSIDELVKKYYDEEHINNERIMYIFLYNNLQAKNTDPEIELIKDKLEALDKAGKTADVLINDKWIKIKNTPDEGNLREVSGWRSHSIKDVKSIRFNGKILYKE